MVLVDAKSNPKSAFEFLAEVYLWEKMQEEKFLGKYYQPVINTQTTKQSCKIIFTQERINPKLEELSLTKMKSKSIDSNEKPREIQRNKAENKKNLFKGRTQNKSFEDLNAMVKEENKKEINQKVTSEKSNGNKNKPKKETVLTIYPNARNYIRLRFMYYPEYIKEGQKFLINDTVLKAVGYIKEIYY